VTAGPAALNLAAGLAGGGTLLPQRREPWPVGAAMALAAHAALIAALALGVSWHVAEPEAVSAELWAAVPQIAAPPAPVAESLPPPPQPRPAPPPEAPHEADIAVARVEKPPKPKPDRIEIQRQQEAERLAHDKAREKAAAIAAKAEEDRLARLREQNLKRLFGQVGASGPSSAAGTARQDAAPSAGYAAKIRGKIKPHIILTGEVAGNPEAVVEVICAFDGTITAKKLVRASGNKEWDTAVLDAIDRTSTLPRDIDNRIPPTITITFRPND
jgi:colicin import membrane protein